MNLRAPTAASQLLNWFGVLGAPLAWAGMHVVGYGVADAACSPAGSGWGLEPNTWATALTIACGTVALAAIVATVRVWRATRTSEDAPPPVGRMHFLATIGLVVAPLFLLLILLAGLGATVLPRCVQS